MTAQMQTATLTLEPLDGLFFRDGRPFWAGNAATSGLPLPQTLAGALRSHLMARLGCDFDALRQALERGADLAGALADQRDDLAAIADLTLSGPWLFRDPPKPDEAPRPHGVLWPVPSILHRPKGGGRDSPLYLLKPRRDAPPGWSTAAAPTTRALWIAVDGATEPVRGWITSTGMSAVLTGQAPAPDTVLEAGDLYDIDRRVGLVVGAATNTAEDGMLYSAGFLRPKPGVTFVAEVEGLTAPLREALDQGPVMGWGGERRQVRVSLKDGGLTRPGVDPAQPPDGSLVVLATPAPLAKGWRGADWTPVAAAVPDPVAVSGWDLARRQPKPTRFAAPAGSAFFFDGEAPAALADGVCDGEDRRLGFGCVLRGVWTHA